jgi:hypothetical protein
VIRKTITQSRRQFSNSSLAKSRPTLTSTLPTSYRIPHSPHLNFTRAADAVVFCRRRDSQDQAITMASRDIHETRNQAATSEELWEFYVDVFMAPVLSVIVALLALMRQPKKQAHMFSKTINGAHTAKSRETVEALKTTLLPNCVDCSSTQTTRPPKRKNF